jgi:hypothetical protein
MRLYVSGGCGDALAWVGRATLFEYNRRVAVVSRFDTEQPH